MFCCVSASIEELDLNQIGELVEEVANHLGNIPLNDIRMIKPRTKIITSKATIVRTFYLHIVGKNYVQWHPGWHQEIT